MYFIRERVLGLGEDSDITDQSGRPVFRVDGKALSLRSRLAVQDSEGREVAQVHRRLAALRPTYKISRNGVEIAEVRKRSSLFGARFSIDVPGDEDLTVAGDFTSHEFTVQRKEQVVARVSKSWLSVRDSYAVDVAPGEDAVLILASVLAMDLAMEMEHQRV